MHDANPGRAGFFDSDHVRESTTMNRPNPFPIDELPIELLQEVFSWCLVSTSKSERVYHSIELQGFTPRTAPLLLCQVSSYWRRVALSFPTLWASLNVYIYMGRARPSPLLISRWLARSGSLPLSLALFQQNESNANQFAAGQILDLFKGYIHRWCNIQFDFAGPRYCRMLPSGRQLSAPMLETFRMHVQERRHHQEEDAEDEKDLLEIFDEVPRLSFLHISRIPALSLAGESVVPVPWNQLVSLSLDYVPSVGTTLLILNKCTYLEECTLKIDSMNGPLAAEIAHPRLASLSISIGNEQLATFLDRLSLPALKQLVIGVRGPLDPYSWPQTHFEAFLKRSESRLLRLEMRDTAIKADEFVACIQNPFLQSLERIVFEDTRDWTCDPFVTDPAMELLTCASFKARAQRRPPSSLSRSERVGSECFLPNLESIKFRGSCLWTADEALADMVESRWRFYCDKVKRLKHVGLEVISSHVEDVRRLQEFASEGLELDLMLR